jgi:hypothetical protein
MGCQVARHHRHLGPKQSVFCMLPRRSVYYFSHIALSSVFFGIDHAVKGGIAYGFLTLIAGGFYG